MRLISLKKTIANNRIRLAAEFDAQSVNGPDRVLWFDFDVDQNDAVVDEVADGMLYALLPVLLRRGEDLVSEVPVSMDTLLNANALVSLLSRNNPQEYHNIRICAPVCSAWVSDRGILRRAIVSGSLGVDSMHTIMKVQEFKTCFDGVSLIFNNTGSNEGSRALMEGRVALARRFASEYGFGFIVVDSNYAEFSRLRYYLTHLFVNMAIGHMLGNGFSHYFISPGYSVDFLSFEGDVAHMESIITEYFTSSRLRVCHLPGDYVPRYEKVKELRDYGPAQKYLNVCFRRVDNCGECGKCSRVLLSLEAADAVDKFSAVFNVDSWKKERDAALVTALRAHWGHDYFIDEMWHELSSNVKFSHRVSACRIEVVLFAKKIYSFLIGLPGVKQIHRIVKK